MTFEQFKIIRDTYLDFYPDDRIEITCLDEALQEAFDLEAQNKEIPEELKRRISQNLASTSLSIMIYFPQLTLTNDYGKTHTIYDVYVKILFPAVVLYLGRSTFTEAEIKAGYIHSHVRKGCFSDLAMFCTGDETTPFNVIRKRVKWAEEKINLEEFQLSVQALIIETERMLKVESNAGGPYITFATVTKNSGHSDKPIEIFPTYGRFGIRSYSVRDKIKDFIKYYCSLGLDSFYFDGKSWQLDTSDAEFIKRVTKVAKKYWKIQYINTNYYKSVYYLNGIYYEKDESSYSLNSRFADWEFKHKYIRFKVLDKNQAVVDDTILNPDIISALYWFLLQLTNTVYANKELNKDNFYSRAYKIKNSLLANLRI